MRHQWRFLLSRGYHRSPLQISHGTSRLQVDSSSLRSMSSLFHTCSLNNLQQRSRMPQPANSFEFVSSVKFTNQLVRDFSTEAVVDEIKQVDPDQVAVTEVFNRLSNDSEIKNELESSGVKISHDLGLKVLRGLESNPDVARRFFDWVLKNDSARLSSKSYNLMLGILGVNGLVDDFWVLVDIMKKRGYGVSSQVRDKVSEKFEKDGLKNDLERLREVFASGSIDNSVEKICSRVCKIVRSGEWNDEMEQKLKDSKITFSSDLVKKVIENLDMAPTKALIFFRWVEESGLSKHDEQTYNAIARVLGTEKYLDRFWKVVDEMKSHDCELEMETYAKVIGKFMERKMVKEAVELYEIAMAGANKPTLHSCTSILKKIAVAKHLDMRLFTRVVKVFTENGNVLTDSILNAVLKSLRTVNRFGECNEVLKVMKEYGFTAGSDTKSKIALGLSRAGKNDEISEFEGYMEGSGDNLDDKALASFVEGHCIAGDLGKALSSFEKMTSKEGVSASYKAYAFEKLVVAYCEKKSANNAFQLLHDHANQVKPWHSTYKLLIRNLLTKKSLADGGFKNALEILGLMKVHGFPPFLDPFVDYVSKYGSSSDGIAFLKAMTCKKFPSLSVALRVFESMLKVSRHSEAQDLLSNCPRYIRSHPDVLNLFYSMKAVEGTPAPAAPTVAVVT